MEHITLLQGAPLLFFYPLIFFFLLTQYRFAFLFFLNFRFLPLLSSLFFLLLTGFCYSLYTVSSSSHSHILHTWLLYMHTWEYIGHMRIYYVQTQTHTYIYIQTPVQDCKTTFLQGQNWHIPSHLKFMTWAIVARVYVCLLLYCVYCGW